MAVIKLHGKLPEDPEKNGLMGRELLEQPRRTALVVALVSTGEMRTDLDTEETTYVLRVRHVELVPEDQRGIAAEMLFRALAARTGALMLPIEPGEEFKAGFTEDEE